MSTIDPSTVSAGSSRPRRANEQPRRPTGRLTAAPSLALAALATAPLAIAFRIASHFGDPQTVVILADRCENTLASSALHALKWPNCAGD